MVHFTMQNKSVYPVIRYDLLHDMHKKHAQIDKNRFIIGKKQCNQTHINILQLLSITIIKC